MSGANTLCRPTRGLLKRMGVAESLAHGLNREGAADPHGRSPNRALGAIPAACQILRRCCLSKFLLLPNIVQNLRRGGQHSLRECWGFAPVRRSKIRDQNSDPNRNDITPTIGVSMKRKVLQKRAEPMLSPCANFRALPLRFLHLPPARIIKAPICSPRFILTNRLIYAKILEKCGAMLRRRSKQ